MTLKMFDTIYVEEGAYDYPLTEVVLSRVSGEVVKILGMKDIPSSKMRARGDDSEKNLVLAVLKGRLVKKCPGTTRHICCNYHVINQVLGCDIGCTYCILKAYLNAPGPVINVNLDDTFRELNRIIARKRRYIYRVGTGELADSLYLDDITGLATLFVEYFSGIINDTKKIIFELKTKNDRIKHLLNIAHRGRTIISWSLNSTNHARREEEGAPDIFERLKAAKEASEAGYYIGFHFDPIISDDPMDVGYRETATAILDYVPPEKLLWISLGAFRAPPALFKAIREDHPDSRITTGESFPGADGKLRYLKPIRVEMYRKMVKWIRKETPDLFIYLCMERRDVWEKVFGFSPKNNAHLDRMFHENLVQKWK